MPIAVLAVECAAASLPRRRCRCRCRCRPDQGSNRRGPVAVLVPAHDEQALIGQTVRSILPQLTKDDRLFVIADNCADATADVARSAGAAVIERSDPDRRGKGYALACGIDAMRAAPPAVVIVCDAD